LDWIGHRPYLLADSGGNLRAALVCPPDPPETAWIRLFAVSSQWSVEEAWDMLWPIAKQQLHEFDNPLVAAIPLQAWFRNLLDLHHFKPVYEIVALLWEPRNPLSPPFNQEVKIRSMRHEDLPAVTKVDSAAFGPLWRNSLEALELAFWQSWIATVAEMDNILVGYQISTALPVGAHLARLAVQPDCQNCGIGYALLWNLIEQFHSRGITHVTVNTQADNLASLALYEKVGFGRTGETYPVYQLVPG